MRVRAQIVLILIGLIAALAAAGYWFVLTTKERPLDLGEGPRTVVVKPGDGLGTVVSRLAEHGIITQPLRVRLYGRLSERANALQAGEYRLEPGMDIDAMLAAMESGDVVTYRLTVVEGWRFQQLREALRNHEAVTTRLDDVPNDEVMERVTGEAGHPEGWFLPQTYHFPRGATDESLLRRAHRAMERTLKSAWENRADDIPLDSPYEALILASIIEKETSVADERRRIAGVFTRRLQRGMRLQTDPTVIYGMGERYDGDIRRSDLRRDTPYNTYTRHGLPPTPIALPGAASIKAAVDPAAGDALYFVATQDGDHYFSETLEEHNRAVQRYQRE